jgi:hypothetical protein
MNEDVRQVIERLRQRASDAGCLGPWDDNCHQHPACQHLWCFPCLLCVAAKALELLTAQPSEVERSDYFQRYIEASQRADRAESKLASPPAPSGWQQRIAAAYQAGWDNALRFYALLPPSPGQNAVDAAPGPHAKDALPPQPVTMDAARMLLSRFEIVVDAHRNGSPNLFYRLIDEIAKDARTLLASDALPPAPDEWTQTRGPLTGKLWPKGKASDALSAKPWKIECCGALYTREHDKCAGCGRALNWPVVHIAANGRALCEFVDALPSQWPQGHAFVTVYEGQSATCTDCKSGRKAAKADASSAKEEEKK